MTTEYKMVPVELLKRVYTHIYVRPALLEGDDLKLNACETAPVPPQGDAQPVAYMAKRVTPTGNPRLDRPLLSLVGEDGWGPAFDCVPLYTRPDSGEVECKRCEAESVGADKAAEAMLHWKREADTLRAQLATLQDAATDLADTAYIQTSEGADALEALRAHLAELVKHPSMSFHQVALLEAALSSSAEPGVKP